MNTSTIIFLLVAICLMLLIVLWPVFKIKWYKRYRPNQIHQAFRPVTTRKRRLVGMIVVCIITIPSCCGIAWILYRTVENAILASSSEKWPKVDGTITNSFLDTYQRSQDGPSTRTAYRALINYSYAFDGEVYNGNRITFGISPFNSTHNKEYAASLVTKYPSGNKVSVYYNPENPELSVLEKGLNGKSLFSELAPVFALGLFVMFLFIAVFISELRKN